MTFCDLWRVNRAADVDDSGMVLCWCLGGVRALPQPSAILSEGSVNSMATSGSVAPSSLYGAKAEDFAWHGFALRKVKANGVVFGAALPCFGRCAQRSLDQVPVLAAATAGVAAMKWLLPFSLNLSQVRCPTLLVPRQAPSFVPGSLVCEAIFPARVDSFCGGVKGEAKDMVSLKTLSFWSSSLIPGSLRCCC